MLKHHNYGLWALVVLFGILCALLLKSYWAYLAFAVLFAVIFHPLYDKLARKMNKNLAAFIITFGILLLLVIPSFYVVVTAIQQAPGAYTGVLQALDKSSVQQILGADADTLRAIAQNSGSQLRTNVVANAAKYVNSAAEILLGMFIMFMTMFFILRDGHSIYSYLLHKLPVRKTNTNTFLLTMRSIINAILLGQLVCAVIQGVLLGLALWIVGVPNPLLWGLLTVLVSIIPFFGPFLVYGPASVYLFLQDRYIAGAVILLYGIIIISHIDNFIRPYIVRRTTEVHPLVVIIGVICGLKLWGLVGFILGPLVLAGFLALFEFSMTGNESVLGMEGPEVSEASRKSRDRRS